MARKRGTYVTKLRVENIKSFKGGHELDLCDVSGKISPWTLILGDNGVGKTTLLQCIGLLSPSVNASDEDPTQGLRYFLEPLCAPEANEVALISRSDAQNAELRATFASNVFLGDKPKATDTFFDLWLQFARTAGKIEDVVVSNVNNTEYEKAPLFLGYGAGRHMMVGNFDPQSLPPPMDSLLVGTVELFDVVELLQYLDYARLKHPSKLAKNQFKILIEMVSALLPDVKIAENITIHGASAFGSDRRTGVSVKTPYGEVSMHELSFGYQTMAAWLCDIAFRLFREYPNSSNPLGETAVVLVDEIDLHLHPVWQRHLREQLLTFFPGVQFIATAHSPLMAQASLTSNMAVVRKEDDTVQIENNPGVLQGWRLDQIITSELFGLPTSYPPEMEELLKERQHLGLKHSLTTQEKARLKYLNETILDIPIESQQNEAAMDIIRRAAALIKPQDHS